MKHFLPPKNWMLRMKTMMLLKSRRFPRDRGVSSILWQKIFLTSAQYTTCRDEKCRFPKCSGSRGPHSVLTGGRVTRPRPSPGGSLSLRCPHRGRSSPRPPPRPPRLPRHLSRPRLLQTCPEDFSARILPARAAAVCPACRQSSPPRRCGRRRRVSRRTARAAAAGRAAASGRGTRARPSNIPRLSTTSWRPSSSAGDCTWRPGRVRPVRPACLVTTCLPTAKWTKPPSSKKWRRWRSRVSRSRVSRVLVSRVLVTLRPPSSRSPPSYTPSSSLPSTGTPRHRPAPAVPRWKLPQKDGENFML